MAAFFLGLLSLALAAAGGLAIWLGFDDRNQGFLIAGAVGISGGCIVLAVALLLREFRKTRAAFENAAVRVAAAMPDHPVAVRPPPAVLAPTPARDSAVAALAAELDPAPTPRTAPAPPPRPVAPPAPPPVEPQPAQKPAEAPRRFARASSAPPVQKAPDEPAATVPAPARAIAAAPKNAVAPAMPPPPDTPAAEPAAAAHAKDIVAPVAPHRADAKAGAPDIDSILDEIIAARDRSLPRPPAASPDPAAAPQPAPQGPTSVVDRLAGLKARMLSGLPSPEALRAAEDQGAGRRSERDDKPRAAAPSSPRDLIGPVMPEPQETNEANASAAAPDEQFHEPSDSALEPAAHATDDEERDDAPERDGQFGSPPAPGFIVASAAVEPPAKAVAQPAARPVVEAAAAPAFPVVNDDPEPPPAPKMVRSFTSGPNRYTMYDDGSIDADTPTGKLNFSSFDELRKFIDEKMGAARAGGARSG